ncbi:porphobilinogen deaminase isoform X1 [Lucilia sericata]|uniref:porphobilinogen deaminase isoform X1 n=2 Tax=Lucilia sericata TaxID=13632 RepID=UPI0018A7FCE8|nr:porphobilinogen deaminase isoform X1 [Lucilia sericata]
MMTSEEKPIRVGSRKSELALIQTKHVISRLQKLYPNKKFEIHTMTTIGDRVLNISLPKIGEKSLFTRDLEDALRNGGVDFVVHSLKDLPTALPTGMAIGAVLEREDARDALVLRSNYKGHTIDTLPKGSVIGTSSLRRTAQLRRQYPNLVVCDIRGNLNTRLAKLDAVDSKFAGIILAQAGLVRMGWHDRISQVLEPTDLLYAVGQGALAVECRSNDTEILSMLRSLMCLSTTCRILAERSFLKTLGGGCSAPVAVFSNLNGDLTKDANNCESLNLHLDGAVWSLDGSLEIREKKSCSLAVDIENNNVEADDSSSDEPPTKRTRRNNSNSPGLQSQNSPPIINDDADVEALTESYNIGELVEKHINLARKCPVVSSEINNDDANGNLTIESGGGDADKTMANACPLPIDIGQDVMGQCPFVGNDAKVALAAAGKCPMTKTNPNSNSGTSSGDQVDCTPSVSAASKCPFASMHKPNDLVFATKANNSESAVHGKCPFLQKTVKMFDYSDDEKPQSQHISNVLIEDVDNLFCGLYQHACHNREFYVKSNRLGQQLAEDLIKKGALDVMKSAQAEIHSKS